MENFIHHIIGLSFGTSVLKVRILSIKNLTILSGILSPRNAIVIYVYIIVASSETNMGLVKENTPPQTHKKPTCICICFTNICVHLKKYKHKPQTKA